MIQRIFHPIGQGAFYTERHKNFIMVYDCGIWYPERNSIRANHLVSSSFKKGSSIDVLFISHFDYDHVSKIDLLKEFKIKRVVLPLLHNEDKIIIRKLYEAINEPQLSEMVDNPISYFPDSQIIFVKSSSEGKMPEGEEDEYQLNELATQEIKSGSKLIVNDWIYVPYNYDYGIRSTKLLSDFLKKRLNADKMLSDPDYLILKRKELQKAYDSIPGKINQNSMFVYSGPKTNNTNKLYMHTFNRRCFRCFIGGITLPGCIYTGDGDLNAVDISHVYSKYIDNVGIIQIPHHGDLNSFSENAFITRDLLCPISVGVNNTYGHPSNQVVANLIEIGCTPLLITEKADDLFIGIIK